MRTARVEVCSKNLGESLQPIVLHLQPPDLSKATLRFQSQGKLQKPPQVDHAVAGMRCTSGNALLSCMKATTGSLRLMLLTANMISINEIYVRMLLLLPWPKERQSWIQNSVILMEICQLMTVQRQRQIIDLFSFCALSFSDPDIFMFCLWGPVIASASPPTIQPRWLCALLLVVQELTLAGNCLS